MVIGRERKNVARRVWCKRKIYGPKTMAPPP
jgi:hypothetical protein